MARKLQISVIGDAGTTPDHPHYVLAENLGETLINAGYRLVSGGMSGIMEAAAKGGRNAQHYQTGDTIGLIPGFDPQSANDYKDIVIPTGLDMYRNVLVANSDAVVAIGGGAGTLSEMALAWTLKRMILAYDVPGWSGTLAGTRIDQRIRLEGFREDKVFRVSSSQEVISLLDQHLHRYAPRHRGLGENPIHKA